MERDLTDISNWDQEDILQSVLESCECFRCGNALRLDHVGGTRDFLKEHALFKKPDVIQYVWTGNHGSEKGMFLYVCDGCGAKWEVYCLLGSDWDVVMNEESPTHQTHT